MNGYKKLWIVALVASIILLTSMIVIETHHNIKVKPEYEHKIGSYLTIAKESNDIETIRDMLDDAEFGMRDVGLDNGSYASVYSWKKIPSNGMFAVYERIDSIRIRIDNTEAWINIMNNGSITGEIVNDQYGSKIRGIQTEISELSDIIWSCFLAKHYPYYTHSFLFVVQLAISISVIVAFIYYSMIYFSEKLGKPLKNQKGHYYRMIHQIDDQNEPENGSLLKLQNHSIGRFNYYYVIGGPMDCCHVDLDDSQVKHIGKKLPETNEWEE